MPKLSAHVSQDVTKLLLIGDSGTGKTGSLVSLIKAGYKLRILDFDNGLDVLVNLLREEPNADQLLSNVTYATCIDKLKTVAGQIVPDGVPQAFPRAMNLLTNWKTEDEDLGPVASWGSDTILVIDSLTFMSRAAFLFTEVSQGFKDPRQTYGEAQKKIENALGILYSPVVKCNVIVISHITFVEPEGSAVAKGYPASIGSALSPRIPRYFNTMLQVIVKGAGANAKRVITSVPSGLVDIKTPLPPNKLPAELPIETGLADFFKILRGNKPIQPIAVVK